MSAAACLKLKLNEETQYQMAVFHEFVEMDLVEDEDYEELMKDEKKLVKTYDKVNERIARRQ